MRQRRQSLSDAVGRAEELAGKLEECRKRLSGIKDEEEKTVSDAENQKKICEEAEKQILDREDDEKIVEAELLDIKVRLSALEGSHEAENGRSEGIEKEIADSEEPDRKADRREKPRREDGFPITGRRSTMKKMLSMRKSAGLRS